MMIFLCFRLPLGGEQHGVLLSVNVGNCHAVTDEVVIIIFAPHPTADAATFPSKGKALIYILTLVLSVLASL